MRAIISAGGSGGHISPAISIARELSKKGFELLYIGNIDSLEERIAKKNKIPFKTIRVQKLYRYFTLKHIFFPFCLIYSLIRASVHIGRFKPDIFVGTGGFVCGSVGLSTVFCNWFLKKKIKIYLHEQNSFPGLSTRVVSRFCEMVFLGSGSAKRFFPKSVFTGNPISSKIRYTNKRQGESKTILILGGSQGSISINKAVLSIANRLLEDGWFILWQAGENNIAELKTEFKKNSRLKLFGFTDNIGQIYADTKIAVARCGALSLAELQEMRIPSVLVPLPSAAANHQYYNALAWQTKGLGIVLAEKSLNQQTLLDAINRLDKDFNKFKHNFTTSSHKDAARKIVEKIVKGE